MIKLIVGLGNYGAEYSETRHNLGWKIVDALFKQYDFSGFNEKFHGYLASGSINDNSIKLLKPKTYMNRSGLSVGSVAGFYKIPPEAILVIHDDLDLECGRLKIKKGGGSGGHNGLKSIDEVIGKEYFRLRVGISHPDIKGMVSDYVLSRWSSQEELKLNVIIPNIIKNISHIIQGDIELFLRQYNFR